MSIATGVGTVLSRGQTVPPGAFLSDTYIAVGRVKGINGPNISKEQVEVTDLDSAGGFKQYLSGLKEPGQCKFGINQDPANSQHVGIRADSQNSTALSQRNWRIVWPNGESCHFVGEVLTYDRDTQPNAPITAEVTIQISGQPEFS